nr:PREDICTED: uncharacterized protein LOC105063157 [Camelus bactrianus]
MGPSTPAGCRALLGCLALLWALPVPSDQEEVRLVQPSLVMAHTRGSTTLPCRTYGSVTYVHWYRQLEGRAPERLLYLALSKRDVQWDSVLRGDKVNAQVNNDGRSCFLSLMKLEKADEGTYYCAAWDTVELYNKIFGGGTKLVVTDRGLDADMGPKSTIFLPSVAEINHHRAGTYLCLLEDFFPDIIKVSWKEKNDNRILQSQQGDTVKTSNTYMKLSWLTVPEKSMDKEHVCVVKHRNNRGETGQEIYFPSINKVVTSIVTTTDSPNDCLKDKREGIVSDSTKACPRDGSEATGINSTKACLKDESNELELSPLYQATQLDLIFLPKPFEFLLSDIAIEQEILKPRP